MIMIAGSSDHDGMKSVITISRPSMAGFLAGLVSLGVRGGSPELRLRGEIPFEGIEAGLHACAPEDGRQRSSRIALGVPSNRISAIRLATAA
jgi:hypothetical protein